MYIEALMEGQVKAKRNRNCEITKEYRKVLLTCTPEDFEALKLNPFPDCEGNSLPAVTNMNKAARSPSILHIPLRWQPMVAHVGELSL